jgi:hypothetical protein
MTSNDDDIESEAFCPGCANAYNGADDIQRCRINGLKSSPANADGCKLFEPAESSTRVQ